MGNIPESAGQLVPTSTDFLELVGSIGESTFAGNVLSLAHRMCGADISSVFHWRCGRTALVASLAPASIDGSDAAHKIAERYIAREALTRDPAFLESTRLPDRSPLFYRADFASGNSANLGTLYREAEIGDRALVCLRSDDDVVGVSLLRTSQSGTFSESELWRLENLLQPLVALCRKHLAVVGSGPNIAESLKSLEAIEECIETGPIPFPRREAQVCARIIYGITTAGVACELGVAEETVSTYRKRIYNRLGIATQRELMLWYLSVWSVWGRQFGERMSIH